MLGWGGAPAAGTVVVVVEGVVDTRREGRCSATGVIVRYTNAFDMVKKCTTNGVVRGQPDDDDDDPTPPSEAEERPEEAEVAPPVGSEAKACGAVRMGMPNCIMGGKRLPYCVGSI